jgi:hypothetical protein
MEETLNQAEFPTKVTNTAEHPETIKWTLDKEK